VKKILVQVFGERRKNMAVSFSYTVQLIASVQNILPEALFTPPAQRHIFFCFTDTLSEMTVLALD